MFLHVKQRPHPTPTLQGESCINLIISRTMGKPKNTKQPKMPRPKPSKTIGEIKNKTFGPMTLFGDIGPTICFFGFPNGF